MTGEPTGRAEWLPVGEEPRPSGNITHYVVTRNNGVSLLSLPGGDIDAEREPATGMYYHDARHLSRLLVTFGGVAPIELDARELEHGLSAVLTNPAARSPGRKTVIPAQTLVLRRRRVVADSLVESLTLSNYGREAVEVDLRVEFDADFADIFVVRGFERREPPPPVHAEVREREVLFRYAGADGMERRTCVRFHTAPAALAPNEAVLLLALDPGQTTAVEFEIDPRGGGMAVGVPAVSKRVRQEQAAWMAEVTSVETNHEAVNDALHRGLLDIEALRTREQGLEYTAAGVPWYDTLFGRDSLLTGIELLAWRPDVLRGALEVLAAYQADHHDPAHDAEPGKIPHELRWGELANIGEVPFGRYYGSVDGTPLFIVAAAEYLRWTGDEATLQALWPNVERAMEWCNAGVAAGVGGFLCYRRVTAAGLENQGWKDSHDAIVWPDGRLVAPPIALVEVQGYLLAAYSSFATLARALRRGGAADAESRRGGLQRRFEAAFAHPELGYALCVAGDGQAVATPASNAGHLLWARVASDAGARAVVRRLFEPDLFSGWGIRTLGTGVPGFNPLGYHVGSVWPHENALILNGLRVYGFEGEALRLAGAIFDTALGFPGHRVPELFSGDDRGLRTVPTPFPVASRPQAWSAASLPYVLTSMLGVRPGAPGQLRVVRPQLPPGIDWVRLRNVRASGGSADLVFRRTEGRVGVEVEAVRNGLEVTLSQSAFEPPGSAPDGRRP